MSPTNQILSSEINEIKRQIQLVCGKALRLESENSGRLKDIAETISAKTEIIERLWPEIVSARGYVSLQRNLARARHENFIEILTNDLPEIERSLENYLLSIEDQLVANTIPTEFLHPIIKNCSLSHLRMAKYREAMLNGIVAIFDLIRKKSLEDEDGPRLCNHVFSLERPILVFLELETETGRNIQKGMLNIINGIYMAMRNPAAHSLD